jgi:hypothetical protein
MANEARNEAWFKACDVNDVVDDRLAEQNRKLGVGVTVDGPIPSLPGGLLFKVLLNMFDNSFYIYLTVFEHSFYLL